MQERNDAARTCRCHSFTILGRILKILISPTLHEIKSSSVVDSPEIPPRRSYNWPATTAWYETFLDEFPKKTTDI